MNSSSNTSNSTPPRVETDRADGTEEHSRQWARIFYTTNTGFLRGNCRTRQAITYFFKIWKSSDEAKVAIAQYTTDTGVVLEERSFSQILYALVTDGKVLHVAHSDQSGRPHKKPVVIWHSVKQGGRHHRQKSDQGNTTKHVVKSSVSVSDEINRGVAEALEKYKDGNPVISSMLKIESRNARAYVHRPRSTTYHILQRNARAYELRHGAHKSTSPPYTPTTPPSSGDEM